jgi:hypothetical protein
LGVPFGSEEYDVGREFCNDGLFWLCDHPGEDWTDFSETPEV